ncbi:hypothetical protein, partial [Nocardia abscessus]|uniref:hypothetical protein n=1 Tax=Nocardia abscessus TaxID=120957 RepID=UPI0024550B73
RGLPARRPAGRARAARPAPPRGRARPPAPPPPPPPPPARPPPRRMLGLASLETWSRGALGAWVVERKT